jgi:glycosyltransferase involved in cell wall biosynthesis
MTLYVIGDRLGWSIDDDRTRLLETAQRLGYKIGSNRVLPFRRRQAVFQHNHFNALQPRWLESSHALGLSYFHGRPGTPGYPEFDRAHDALRKNAARVNRVQVTHGEMNDLVLDAGVEANRVHRIPIGVDLANFPLVDDARRADARNALDLPVSAFVVGSFVKDGVGLAEGREPKLVKGPDTLVQVLARLRGQIPELVVLLTGPARGYVRSELERLDVPYRHTLLATRADLASAYHATDLTLVTSRQEGGPKAVLESLAAGVPLVTTRVGQAGELVSDGENGLLAEVDDVDELVSAVVRVHGDSTLAARLRLNGRSTAEQLDDPRLDPLWHKLLEGFVHAK